MSLLTIYGTDAADFFNPNIYGLEYTGYEIFSLGGDDIITVTDSIPTIIFSAGGNDVLRLFDTNDRVNSGTGDDIVYMGAGNDFVDGGDGNDTLYGEAGNDLMFGLYGDDTMFGGTGNDVLNGNWGHDWIYGGDGDDTIDGGAGNDVIDGEAGNDVIDGGIGNDLINGGIGNDVINSGTGNDVINGGNGADTVYGGRGSDVIYGGAGNDHLYGGKGNDVIYGGSGDDYINGGKGHNTLFGDVGNDVIVTGDHTSTVDGGDGDDVIIARLKKGGDHTLTGGEGADTFEFIYQNSRKSADVVITDFELGVDGFMINGQDDQAWVDASFALGTDVLTEVDGNVVLDIGANDTITFVGMTELEFMAHYAAPVEYVLDFNDNLRLYNADTMLDGNFVVSIGQGQHNIQGILMPSEYGGATPDGDLEAFNSWGATVGFSQVDGETFEFASISLANGARSINSHMPAENWANTVTVNGYSDDLIVQSIEINLTLDHVTYDLNWQGIDHIEFVASGGGITNDHVENAGWFSMDDLVFLV